MKAAAGRYASKHLHKNVLGQYRQKIGAFREDQLEVRVYIGSISASPAACRLRGYGRAGTQNDRLGESFPMVCTTCPGHVDTRVDAHVCTHVQAPAQECARPVPRRRSAPFARTSSRFALHGPNIAQMQPKYSLKYEQEIA